MAMCVRAAGGERKFQFRFESARSRDDFALVAVVNGCAAGAALVADAEGTDEGNSSEGD